MNFLNLRSTYFFSVIFPKPRKNRFRLNDPSLRKAEQQYSSSDADSWTQEPKKKKIHYDKISVWPSAMFEDWVQKWKDQAVASSPPHTQPPPPPKPLPRTASLHDKLFRARSMAPASANQNELQRSNTTIGGGWYDRATSAPPAAPPPVFRRYRKNVVALFGALKSGIFFSNGLAAPMTSADASKEKNFKKR